MSDRKFAGIATLVSIFVVLVVALVVAVFGVLAVFGGDVYAGETVKYEYKAVRQTEGIADIPSDILFGDSKELREAAQRAQANNFAATLNKHASGGWRLVQINPFIVFERKK